MMTIGMILWVLVLIWMVGLLYPSQEMRRQHARNGMYYLVWALLVGIALIVHYRIVTHLGHVMLGVRSDIIGIALGAVRLFGLRISSHNLNTHQQ